MNIFDLLFILFFLFTFSVNDISHFGFFRKGHKFLRSRVMIGFVFHISIDMHDMSSSFYLIERKNRWMKLHTFNLILNKIE